MFTNLTWDVHCRPLPIDRLHCLHDNQLLLFPPLYHQSSSFGQDRPQIKNAAAKGSTILDLSKDKINVVRQGDGQIN